MGSSATGDQWSTEVLSSEPRISICHNFLTKEECEYLINFGRPRMNRSRVFDPENPNGGGRIFSGRTSTGMFLTTQNDKVGQDIRKRISDYTTTPMENIEGLQILHYEVGQYFVSHHDYFTDERKIVIGSQRKVTVVMYLSDVEEGGEMFFPKAKISNDVIINSSNVRSTDKGIFVKPKMCDALLFWDLKPDGSVDPLTMHGSAPVIKGDKWACTLWLHDARFQYVVRPTPLNLASSTTIIPRAAKTSSKRLDDSQHQRGVATRKSTLSKTYSLKDEFNNMSLVEKSDKPRPSTKKPLTKNATLSKTYWQGISNSLKDELNNMSLVKKSDKPRPSTKKPLSKNAWLRLSNKFKDEMNKLSLVQPPLPPAASSSTVSNSLMPRRAQGHQDQT